MAFSSINQGSLGAMLESLKRAVDAATRLDEQCNLTADFTGPRAALVEDLKRNMERAGRHFANVLRDLPENQGLHLIGNEPSIVRFTRSDGFRKPTDPTTPGAA